MEEHKDKGFVSGSDSDKYRDNFDQIFKEKPPIKETGCRMWCKKCRGWQYTFVSSIDSVAKCLKCQSVLDDRKGV